MLHFKSEILLNRIQLIEGLTALSFRWCLTDYLFWCRVTFLSRASLCPSREPSVSMSLSKNYAEDVNAGWNWIVTGGSSLAAKTSASPTGPSAEIRYVPVLHSNSRSTIRTSAHADPSPTRPLLLHTQTLSHTHTSSLRRTIAEGKEEEEEEWVVA